MKKFGFRAALAALLWVLLSVPVWAADVLIPVGRAVGLELEAAGLAVAELDPDLGGNARDAGMQVGDIIIKADGQPVDDAASLQATGAYGVAGRRGTEPDCHTRGAGRPKTLGHLCERGHCWCGNRHLL